MHFLQEPIMESKRSHVSFAPLLAAIILLSQNLLLVPVMSSSYFEDQKNYYSSPVPDPRSGTTPPPSSGSSSSPHSPSHGSGSGHGSRTPSHGGNNNNCGSPPSSSSNPPSSGGYYNSPPSYGNPPTPISVSPPTTPIDPGTPTIPSPPFLPSPFTGTCNYWSNHPGIIWGVLGWWGTLGNAFGVTSIPGFSSGITLPQALSNTRTDGVGALLREGTASYLNSLVNNKFPYTTTQVRDRFVASLGSNKAAAAQARLFKMANEGRMKPRP